MIERAVSLVYRLAIERRLSIAMVHISSKQPFANVVDSVSSAGEHPYNDLYFFLL